MPEASILTIALDIDDLLTSMDVHSLRARSWLDPVHHAPDRFFTVRFTYTGKPYDIENVLTPGCLEFLRFLFEHPQVRPAFFSAGIRERNVALAEMVVRMVVDHGGNPAWMERYDVFSREDCFDTQRLSLRYGSEVAGRFRPERFFGNLKKDLRVVHYGREEYERLQGQTLLDQVTLLPDPERDAPLLENVLLVEEDSSYLFPGQERNLLLCPTYRHAEPYMVNHADDSIPATTDWLMDFRHSNPLFYAAGVLQQVFERQAAEGLSLQDLVWEEQGLRWFDRESKLERFPTHFFTLGRTVLRAYNPKLNFAVTADRPPSD